MKDEPPLAPPASGLSAPGGLALLYWVGSVVWILLSDRALLALVRDPDDLILMESIKAWAFVTLTALVLYLALRRRDARLKVQTDILAREQAFIASALDSLRDVFVVLDRDAQRLVRWNKRLPEVSGYSDEEIARMHPADFFVGANTARVDEAIAQIRHSGETMLEVSLLTREGETIPCELRGTPLADRDGDMIGICGIGRDVRQRKKAEAELVESEERYRVLVEQSPDGIGVYQDDVLVYANPASCSMLGAERADQVLGCAATDFISSQDYVRVARQLGPAFRRGEADVVEINLRRLDGAWIDVESEVAPIVFKGRPAVQYIFRDITERKAREGMLRLLDRALASVGEGILITDPRLEDNPVIYCNPAFEGLTGYASSEVLGRNCRFLQREDHDQEDLAVLRAAIAQERDCKVVLRNYRKDGTLFWNELTVAPVWSEEGGVTHFVGVQNDITERQVALEELHASEERWRVLVEHHPDALLIYTRPGIRYANPAALSLLGAASIEMLEKYDVRDFILPEYLEQFDARREQLREAVVLPTVEYGIQSLTGTTHYVEATSQWTNFGGKPSVQTVLRDVTWRVEAQRSLEDRNRELEGLLNMGQWLTRTLDIEDLFDIVIASVLSMIPGADATSVWIYSGATNQLTVRAWQPHDIFEEEFSVDADSDLMKDVLASQSATRVTSPAAAYRRAISPGDVPVHRDRVRATLGLPLVFKERLLGVILVDSYAREDAFGERIGRLLQTLGAQIVVALQNSRLYRRIHNVSMRLVEAQEAERRRVAHELHDEVGGLLTALQISLKTMPATGAGVQRELYRATELVGTLMQKIRHVTLNLRPSMLDDLGLPAALDWFVGRYMDQMKIAVHLQTELSPGERLPAAVETAAYRIIQEALTNVARHAGVEEVIVVLRRQDARLLVHVIDDGQGFDLDSVDEGSTSVGLSGMRERAKLLGGRLEIASAPGAGTMITAILPLSPNQKAD